MSEEKTRFFIGTAHDIRTPLTLIKAPLEEMVERQQVKQAGEDNLKMALRSVNNLLRLVTDLINFERSDMYTPQLYIGEYELDSYLESTCEAFHTYASLKNISFTRTGATSRLNVWFDRDKMDSILKNLLSNALKYTPRNGSVQVRAFTEGHTWGIEITDTGIGIPPRTGRILVEGSSGEATRLTRKCREAESG